MRITLLELLAAIDQGNEAIAHWDALQFDRATREQERLYEQISHAGPVTFDEECIALLRKLQATLRSYRIVVEHSSRWCSTLRHILDRQQFGETSPKFCSQL